MVAPAERKSVYDRTWIKAAVPKRYEKPIMNLKSNKNYLISNAVENILSGIK